MFPGILGFLAVGQIRQEFKDATLNMGYCEWTDNQKNKSSSINNPR